MMRAMPRVSESISPVSSSSFTAAVLPSSESKTSKARCRLSSGTGSKASKGVCGSGGSSIHAPSEVTKVSKSSDADSSWPQVAQLIRFGEDLHVASLRITAKAYFSFLCSDTPSEKTYAVIVRTVGSRNKIHPYYSNRL